MIRLLLLEPDRWRYSGFCRELSDASDVEVVGTDDYASVLDAIEPRQEKVDVVMLSYGLVQEHTLAIIPRVKRAFSGANVLVHGDSESLDVTAQICAAGARGYFTLSSSPGHLLRAIHLVSEGKYWGPREALEIMAERASQGEKEPAALSEDDLALLRYLADGLANKEIAQRLGLAEPTIKGRLNRLYRRFGVTTRLQLLATAMRRGLIVSRGSRLKP